jgi:hypothetical protein
MENGSNILARNAMEEDILVDLGVERNIIQKFVLTK